MPRLNVYLNFREDRTVCRSVIGAVDRRSWCLWTDNESLTELYNVKSPEIQTNKYNAEQLHWRHDNNKTK